MIFNKMTIAVASFFSLAALVSLLSFHASRMNFNNDVWKDTALLKRYPMPVEAVNRLKQKNGNGRLNIFNEFAWGGYLIWTMPEAKVFFDGRGTATWRYSDSTTMLERYHQILQKPDGLKAIESGPSNYIMLARVTNTVRPDAINKLLFPKSDLEKMFIRQPLQLEIDLAHSKNWELVYEDAVAWVWQKKM